MIAAIILFIYLIPTVSAVSEIWLPLLFFIIISIMAEFIPVSLPEGGEITITFPIDFVVILVYGPGIAMIVSAFSSIGLLFGKDNKIAEKILFNASQFSISSGLAGIIYHFSGGLFGHQNFFNFVLPATLCALTYCIINSFFSCWNYFP